MTVIAKLLNNIYIKYNNSIKFIYLNILNLQLYKVKQIIVILFLLSF